MRHQDSLLVESNDFLRFIGRQHGEDWGRLDLLHHGLYPIKLVHTHPVHRIEHIYMNQLLTVSHFGNALAHSSATLLINKKMALHFCLSVCFEHQPLLLFLNLINSLLKLQR